MLVFVLDFVLEFVLDLVIDSIIFFVIDSIIFFVIDSIITKILSMIASPDCKLGSEMDAFSVSFRGQLHVTSTIQRLSRGLDELSLREFLLKR